MRFERLLVRPHGREWQQSPTAHIGSFPAVLGNAGASYYRTFLPVHNRGMITLAETTFHTRYTDQLFFEL